MQTKATPDWYHQYIIINTENIMRYDAIIFDMDGTILDTLKDLHSALNVILTRHALPARTLEEVRHFVGNGAAKLVERALPSDASEEFRADFLREFQAYYSAHSNEQTAPYDGILPLLHRIKSAGIPMACNSNKFENAVHDLCELHFPNCFCAFAGDRVGVPKKPAPDGALRVMREMNAVPDRTLFVGDSDVDLATAKNARMNAAWVTWGFRRRGEITVDPSIPPFDTPEALGDYILQ